LLLLLQLVVAYGLHPGLEQMPHVVICLCRLAGPTGAPDVARQLMRLRLSAVWVLMVAFEGPVTVPGGMEGEAKHHAADAPLHQLLSIM
jgi:hypothetical protein